MKEVFFILISLILLTSCEGYYQVSGTVCVDMEEIKTPLDSCTVKVYCGTDFLRGTAITDSIGGYSVAGLTTPAKATYFIVFERTDYLTDTIEVKGNKGKTIITLDKTMIKVK